MSAPNEIQNTNFWPQFIGPAGGGTIGIEGNGIVIGPANTINFVNGLANITIAGGIAQVDISGTGISSLNTDVVATGPGAAVATIQPGAVTLSKMANLGTNVLIGAITAGTPVGLTTTQVKNMLNLAGTNSGDVTLAGQNYLTLTGQAITANAVDLSGANATGILAASRFPAMLGDVTNAAGNLTNTVGKIGGVSVAAGNNPLPQYFYKAGAAGGATAFGGSGATDLLVLEATSSSPVSGLSNAFIQIGATGHTQGIFIGSTTTPTVGPNTGTTVAVAGYSVTMNSTVNILSIKGPTNALNCLSFADQTSELINLSRAQTFAGTNTSFLFSSAIPLYCIATTAMFRGSTTTFIGSDDAPSHTQSTTTTISGSAVNVGSVAGCNIGFFGATAVAQPTATGATGFVVGAGTPATSTSTYTGGVGATAYTVGDVVAALKNLGLVVS